MELFLFKTRAVLRNFEIISRSPRVRYKWLSVAKIKVRIEASRRKSLILIFDVELRFALLDSLR